MIRNWSIWDEIKNFIGIYLWTDTAASLFAKTNLNLFDFCSPLKRIFLDVIWGSNFTMAFSFSFLNSTLFLFFGLGLVLVLPAAVAFFWALAKSITCCHFSVPFVSFLPFILSISFCHLTLFCLDFSNFFKSSPKSSILLKKY